MEKSKWKDVAAEALAELVAMGAISASCASEIVTAEDPILVTVSFLAGDEGTLKVMVML